jgi:2-dehydropantoate 2-reductase
MLAEAGNDVTLVARRPEHIAALNQGLILTNDEKGTRTIPVKACRADELSGEFDLILLITKTTGSRAALESVKHVISPATTVLSIQNGLGNGDVICEFVDPSQALIGMTVYPCDRKSDREVVTHGFGSTAVIGVDGKVTERAQKVCDAFNEAGLNCETNEKVLAHIWQKCCFNAAANSISAITYLPMGALAEGVGHDLEIRIIREGIDVANRCGVDASFEETKTMFENACVAHYGHDASMLIDAINGRETEVDFINGGIVSAAKKIGMEAPINETIMDIVKLKTMAFHHSYRREEKR